MSLSDQIQEARARARARDEKAEFQRRHAKQLEQAAQMQQLKHDSTWFFGDGMLDLFPASEFTPYPLAIGNHAIVLTTGEGDAEDPGFLLSRIQEPNDAHGLWVVRFEDETGPVLSIGAHRTAPSAAATTAFNQENTDRLLVAIGDLLGPPEDSDAQPHDEGG